MLSEASDVVICYALLLRIKANVAKEDSYTVCEITHASNDHLSVLFYSFNSLKKRKQVFICLSVQIFHSEISPCFVALNPHDLVPLKL